MSPPPTPSRPQTRVVTGFEVGTSTSHTPVSPLGTPGQCVYRHCPRSPDVPGYLSPVWVFGQFSGTGLELLREDATWLSRLLSGLPPGEVVGLLDGYALAWLEGMDAEPTPHRKQNKGRRAANTWLRRLFVASYRHP